MSAAPDPQRRTPLETMLDRALDGDTVVLASNTGWPSVVLLPWDEYEYLLECRREHEDRIDAAIAEEALAEAERDGWVSLEDCLAEIEQAEAEAAAEAQEPEQEPEPVGADAAGA